MNWRGWFSQARRDREREEELQAHIALHVEALVARGLSIDEARRQARVMFGNARARREELADMQGLPVLDNLIRDVRYALRMMRRAPGFTLTAVSTLALVIGANTAVFTLANALLLRPLPFPNADQLALVSAEFTSPRGASTGNAIDGAAWQALAASPLGPDAAVFTNWATGVNLVVNAQARFADQQRVGAGFFRILGVPPAIGREFRPEEDVPGGPPVAILSHDLWARAFHGDPNVVGQTIFLRGEPSQVIGVMPESFRGTADADLWTPLRPTTTGEGGGTNYQALVRISRGTTSEVVAGYLAPVAESLRRDLPAELSVEIGLTPLKEVMTSDNREPLTLLAAAVMTVLVIACVNLAVLLLARGSSRTKEIATRMALGSGRRAVVRQLMVESVLLAVAGGLSGLVVGWGALRGLQALGGTRFADWQRVTIDGEALAWCAGLSLLTSLIFGLVPAWQSTRVDVQHALVEGGSRAVAGGTTQWTRRGLIVAQVALGVVLLVSAGLLTRTFLNLQSIAPGFNPAGLTTATVSLLDARYRTPAEVQALFTRTLEQIAARPGVESAAVSLGLPYERALNMGFRFAGANTGRTASVMYVTPDFFRTFDIPLLRGRSPASSDTAQSRPVVVVNASFARLYSSDAEVMGRVVRLAGVDREVVGVSGDVQMQPGFQVDGMVPGPIVSSPTIFLPAAQVNEGVLGTHIWFSPVWTVRASSPAVGAQVIAEAMHSTDPLLPLGPVRQMTEVRATATSTQTMLMTLVGAVALVALLLTAIGLHGLIAHSVTERTREFGIRLALGASAAGSMRSVVGSGMTLAAVGAAIGVVLAVPASSLVASVLYGVAERDPLTYVGAAGFLFVVASVASLLPALRILRLDPATTLRQ